MIITINSKENSKVKHAYSLKNQKYRNQFNEFLVEGIKTLEMALEANCVKEVFTTKEIKSIPSNIPQYLVNETVIEKLSSAKSPEGVVGVCSFPKFNENYYKKVVYLDCVNDPGNLGTIIRTALAFNYDAVVLSKNTVSPYNEKALAASKGSIFSIPVFYDELQKYNDEQKIIVSTLEQNSVSLEQIEKTGNFVIVLGNEAHGVSEETKQKSDINVKIDIDNIDSLNVSVAAGILLHYLA